MSLGANRKLQTSRDGRWISSAHAISAEQLPNTSLSRRRMDWHVDFRKTRASDDGIGNIDGCRGVDDMLRGSSTIRVVLMIKAELDRAAKGKSINRRVLAKGFPPG